MLWILVILLLLLWVGGFSLSIAGSFIHLLLVLAVIVAIYNLVVSRGHAV
ncbi:MAG TPA: lmo0937 family membrane protein [Chloroflexota bacterium]